MRECAFGWEDAVIARADWSGAEEPLLDEVLSDPIVRAVMRRDGLERADVEKAASVTLAARAEKAAAKRGAPPISA